MPNSRDLQGSFEAFKFSDTSVVRYLGISPHEYDGEEVKSRGKNIPSSLDLAYFLLSLLLTLV